jgi:predicted ATPase
MIQQTLEVQGRAAASGPAEACFDQAIEIARRQSARSLELRVVMSLTRLWHKHGKEEQGRRMLQEIYGWFAEGFDTADLQEAKALLEELASSQGYCAQAKHCFLCPFVTSGRSCPHVE